MSDKQETAVDVAARLLPCDCGKHFAPLAELASDECPASWRPDVAEAIEAAVDRERSAILARIKQEQARDVFSVALHNLAAWILERGKA